MLSWSLARYWKKCLELILRGSGNAFSSDVADFSLFLVVVVYRFQEMFIMFDITD